jgi:hypothetical protein
MKNVTIKLIALQIGFLLLTAVPGLNLTKAASASEAKVTAPAGTHLMAKLDSALDSKKHKTGHKFTASLEGAIVVDGKEVAPRGSTVYGQLAETKKSGRLAGKSEMQISLTHILINDQLHPIMTSGVKAVTENTGKKTAGTTARGAAIGALAGGSSGAKTGAAVGLGLSILTRGNNINIPAGTLLDFTLAAPLTP